MVLGGGEQEIAFSRSPARRRRLPNTHSVCPLPGVERIMPRSRSFTSAALAAVYPVAVPLGQAGPCRVASAGAPGLGPNENRRGTVMTQVVRGQQRQRTCCPARLCITVLNHRAPAAPASLESSG